MKKNICWIAIPMIAIVAMGLLMGGCEKKGPMEKAGEKIDETIDDAKDSIDGDESLGEKIEEGVEELGDKIEDATDG